MKKYILLILALVTSQPAFAVSSAIQSGVSGASAQLMGGVVVTGCAAAWATGSTTFAAFATQTGCTYTTFGQAQAPATNIPGFKFASLPPGDYMIQYEGFAGNTVAAKTAFFQFTDGTITARETSAVYSSGSMLVPTINQSFSYTSTQTNMTWQMYGKTDSGGTTSIYGTTANPGTFKLWFFPKM